MYSHHQLHEDLREQLVALEEELGLPIRVIHSRTWPFPWTADSAGAYSRQEAEARGLTLSMWHCPNEGRRVSMELTDEVHVADVRQPASDPAIPVRYDDRLVGQIEPRLVHCYLPLWNVTYGDLSAFHETLVAALRYSLDPELEALAEQRRREAELEALRLFVSREYEGKITNARRVIDSYQTQIADSRSAVAALARNLRQQQQELDALLMVRGQADVPEAIIAEWKLVTEHPRITASRFEAEEGVLVLTTDDIRLYNEETDESRWLGRFEIRITIAELDIRLSNLDNPRGGRDHPHVVGGRPCFGGHDDAIYELLGRGEFYTAVDMVLQYLETFNINDEYGRYGAYWFDVEDARPLVNEEVAV